MGYIEYFRKMQGTQIEQVYHDPFFELCEETQDQYFRLFSKMTVPEIIDAGRALFFRREWKLSNGPQEWDKLTKKDKLQVAQLYFLFASEYLLDAEHVLTSFDKNSDGGDDRNQQREKGYGKHKPFSFFRSLFSGD